MVEMLNTPKIVIRYGENKDHVLLAEFGAKAFTDSFAGQNTPENMAAYISAAFSPHKQAQELAEPTSTFLIAQIEEDVVGYARLLAGPAPNCVSGDNPIELVRIYADQNWIGMGIGSALMQASLDEARKQDHDTIWLGVWEHNPRAIAFYQKWGFNEVGSHHFQLGNEQQLDMIMQRSLH
jgi:ribosomal protein S18 acetylase RimI-like enzyme